MFKRLRSHIGRHVVGYIALFFALGGSTGVAVAAVTPALVVDANHSFTYSGGNFLYTQASCGSGIICEWATDNEEPVFTNGGPLTVYNDGSGTIHMSGAICMHARYIFQPAGTGGCPEQDDQQPLTKVGTMPAGYRPAHNMYFKNTLHGNDTSYIAISTAGNVFVYGAGYATFDGISFRNG